MKKNWLASKILVAAFLCGLFTVIAEKSVYACAVWFLYQPPVPKKLLKK